MLLTGSAAPHPPPPPLRPDGAVTVFIAGDSIAAAYAAEEWPRAGWGQALGLFLAEDVRVRDEAWPGASSRTFVEDGRLDRILAAVEPGDYLVVSFGHNDQMPDERHTDPETGYRDQLRLFVERARDAGAVPVLVTPVERRRFDTAGRARASLGAYPAAMAEVARADRDSSGRPARDEPAAVGRAGAGRHPRGVPVAGSRRRALLPRRGAGRHPLPGRRRRGAGQAGRPRPAAAATARRPATSTTSATRTAPPTSRGRPSGPRRASRRRRGSSGGATRRRPVACLPRVAVTAQVG